MALKPGTQLGPYEITTPLGAGGMGEVYRATDTKLKRDVAIKVLPEAFTSDPSRRRRFPLDDFARRMRSNRQQLGQLSRTSRHSA